MLGVVVAVLGSVAVAQAESILILDPCTQCHRLYPPWVCYAVCG